MRSVAVIALALWIGILSTPRALDAQPASKTARVVYVHDAGVGPLEPAYLEAFRQAMRDLGWSEGRNLVLEQRITGNPEQRRAVSAEMDRLKPDVVFAPVAAYWMAPSGLAPLKGIPIVFAGISDPIALGMVASLARPGANVTGFMYQGVELNVKRLQLLTEAFPRARRIGVLVPTDHRARDRMVREIEAAAKALNVTLLLQAVAGTDPPTLIDAVFEAMVKERADAVLGLQGAIYYRERGRIADLALRHRLPGMFEVAGYPEAGCLMSYAPDLLDLHRRAAGHVDKILRGRPPGELPVEQPTTFELVVNLRAAKAIGVVLAREFLTRADRLIE